MPLPSPEDFLLNTSLYDNYKISDDFNDVQAVLKLFFHDGKLDCLCSECKKNSIFINVDSEILNENEKKPYVKIPIYRTYFNTQESRASLREIEKDNKIAEFRKIVKLGHFQKVYKCSRDESHLLFFDFYITNDKIIKIGQFPSSADLSKGDINKYRKILGKEKYKEFNRAIGLNAFGVGIGSLVYLRRIFENLIEEAHNEAKDNSKWQEDLYIKARMDEKIGLLRSYLPEILVSNKKLYSVVSKGIHELSEEECLDIFPIIRGGIELILDEKIAKKEKEEKIKTISKAISDKVEQYK